MILRRTISVVVLLTWSGCSFDTLRPDPSLPPILASYPSIQTTVRSRPGVGNRVVSILRGANLSSVKIVVQGYGRGKIRFVSKACGLDKTVSYIQSQRVPLKWLSGKATRDCIVSIVVSPDFDKEVKLANVISSLEGHVLIKVLDRDHRWIGGATNIKGKEYVKFTSIGPGNLTVYGAGCGKKYKKKFKAPSHDFMIEISEMIKKTAPFQCVLEGVVLNESSGHFLFTKFVSRGIRKKNGKTFVPLPDPLVILRDGTIGFMTDHSVSMVIFDGISKIGEDIEFEFDESQPHYVNIWTVSGRTITGIYEKNKSWLWIK